MQQPHGATNWKTPGTSASSAPGDTAWVDADHIKAVDSNYATCTRAATGTSEQLLATNFGFTVPDGAVILGYRAAVVRHFTKTDNGGVLDYRIRLVQGGAAAGDNKISLVGWNEDSDTTAIYGGALDRWGTTYTAAQIRASTFGLVVRATLTTTDDYKNYLD